MNSKVKKILFVASLYISYVFNTYIFLSITDNVPEEHVANIHQDDDGFESLNGNVSSDNDKGIGRAQVQENKSRLSLIQSKDHMSWSEDSTSQQVSSKNSGLSYKYTLVK